MTVELGVSPCAEGSSTAAPAISFEDSVEEQLPLDVKQAVENGIQSAYLQGNGALKWIWAISDRQFSLVIEAPLFGSVSDSDTKNGFQYRGCVL